MARRALLPPLLLALLSTPHPSSATSGRSGAAPGAFRCARGTAIPHSSRSAAAPCPEGAAGAECAYSCDAGYLAVGRHVCQSYSTMGVAVIEAAYFGGRCEKLCGASPSDWSCAAGLTPVRLNASGADGAPCLSTTCLPPTEALFRLARGNYEVWRLGRHNRTGMYIDHVDPLLPYASQQWTMASADGAGPGLAIECVAAALGFITLEEAAARVLLTLRSFAGLTPGFRDARNQVNPPAREHLVSLGCVVSPSALCCRTVGSLHS